MKSVRPIWPPKYRPAVILTSVALTIIVLSTTGLSAEELPPEKPLWEDADPPHAFERGDEEQVRSLPAKSNSPSGKNRAYSRVSTATYSIHRPEEPSGVGLVICPGGGFRDVWIDREGHDLAIWLKQYGITSLVLKYRTRPLDVAQPNAWQNYQLAVQADGRQAIRTLRTRAETLELQPNKIGICGFSAGGHLSISCTLYNEPKRPSAGVSGMPNFTGLFYPGIPEGAEEQIELRSRPESQVAPLGPFFIVNARVDKLTPVEKCLEFYASLLDADVNAELHIFNTGSHGFGLGAGRGHSTEMWPTSFVAWLKDIKMLED